MDSFFRKLSGLLIFCFVLGASLAFGSPEHYTQSRPDLESPGSSIKAVIQDASYILVLDGGGTKVSARLLSGVDYTLLSLYKQGKAFYETKGLGCNLNIVGYEGFQELLGVLFSDLQVFQNGKFVDFDSIKENCAIVGGLAGLGSLKNRETAKELFLQAGFRPERIALASDLALSLLLVKDQGAIVISGTGFSSMAKYGESAYRLGFPTSLNAFYTENAGSDFIACKTIGLLAEREVLSPHLSPLGAAVLDQLGKQSDSEITSFRTLVSQVRNQKITKRELASLAPLVFESAYSGDFIAKSVISESANYIGKLLAIGFQKANPERPFELCLIGGTFNTPYYEEYLNEIIQSSAIPKESLKINRVAQQEVFPDIVRGIAQSRN